jgi:hypothetical protein
MSAIRRRTVTPFASHDMETIPVRLVPRATVRGLGEHATSP